MDIANYQEWTEETDIYTAEYPDFLDAQELRLAIGLADEASEVLGKYKKAIRENEPSYIENSDDELGDTLWYFARLLTERGSNFEEIATKNVEKLTDRQVRGVIEGEGDNR